MSRDGARRLKQPLIGLSAIVLLTACPQRTAVWIGDGSTASDVVFRIADKRDGNGDVAIGVVRVYACDGSDSGGGAMWVAGPQGGTVSIHQIVYGELPPNWESDQGPKALTPGCYRVASSGTGRTEFVVGADGTVTEHSEVVC